VTPQQAAVRPQKRVRYEVDAVSRALAILKAIVENETVGLTEAAELAGVSKSTAFRLLATLEEAGLVEHRPARGYAAGAEAFRWASHLIGGLEVRNVAMPHLLRLRDATSETVNLAVLRGSAMVYVAILESPSALRMADVPGSGVPIHAAALGRAVAAHLEPARLAELLGPEPYDKLTPRTPTSWVELASELQATQSRGYAVDREEVAVGVTCVAAPLLAQGVPVGAISVSSPSARLDEARIAEIGRLVAQTAEAIRLRLTPDRSTRAAK
jgi:DNA-binding IclR family transcriptional regulator